MHAYNMLGAKKFSVNSKGAHSSCSSIIVQSTLVSNNTEICGEKQARARLKHIWR